MNLHMHYVCMHFDQSEFKTTVGDQNPNDQNWSYAEIRMQNISQKFQFQTKIDVRKPNTQVAKNRMLS